jgi:uncharacterized protein YigA (DUF484 family)
MTMAPAPVRPSLGAKPPEANSSAYAAQASRSKPPARQAGLAPDARALDRRIWANWLLITGMCVVITLGLAAGLLPLLRAHADSPWPWPKTETSLIVALAVAVFVLTAFLTWQQRRLNRLRSELEVTREAALAGMRRHYDRLMALLSVSQIMVSETDVQTIFDTITNTCMRTFDCEQVSLMIVDSQSTEVELVVRSAAGHTDRDAILGARHRLGEGVSGCVAESREPLVLGPNPIPARLVGIEHQAASLTAAMIVPILVRSELVGVLNVGTRRPEARYDDEDLRALQVFAENAGTCIRHAEQSHWMRQTIATLRATH